MKNLDNYFKMIFAIIVFGVAIVSIQNEIVIKTQQLKYSKQTIDDSFRSEFYSEEQRNHREKYADECKSIISDVESEVIYYPVVESSVDKSYSTTFTDSWMSERTFGGNRGHEGADIMATVNKRGVYPVISMTDGVITNLGWLEKGGYRVGITSDSGIYYYYAHLDSYSNIKEGQRVRAGEILGYMGDSGYGPEGTKGKFAVHLHIGIYVYVDGIEVSLNPYYILCQMENNKLKYAYS